jgi:hypothetical protein
MLIAERWQLDYSHHLNNQDFWLQQVHILIVVQQPDSGHATIY